MKNKKYIPCEVCYCDDCRTGLHRLGSWYCPVLKKQICEICCYYDMDAIGERQTRIHCKEIKCLYLKD